MNIPSVSPFSSIGHEPEFGPRVLIPHYEASHASEEDHRESSADPVNQFATRELSSSLNRPYQAEPIDRFTDSECVVIEVDDNATASDIESESSSESEPGTSTESESSTSSEFYRRNNRDNNQENFIRIKDHIFEPHRLYQGEGECCYYCTLRGRAQLYDSTNQEFYTRNLI